MTGLPFDHVQHRNFLIWLCRTEQFVAHAYGTQVGIAGESNKTTEAIEIFASSDLYNVDKTLGIEKLSDGTYRLFDRSQIVTQAKYKDEIFLGLQGSTNNIPSDHQELFRRLWDDLKPKSMWRQR